MPLSEEFVEHQHSIDKTNIVQTMQAQSEFISESQETSSCCGCLRNCIYVGKFNMRNPTHSMLLRDQLRNYRSKLPRPKFDQVRALIQHVVSKLKLNPTEIKNVVIQALILVERMITNSQTFELAAFKNTTRQGIFEFLQTVVSPSKQGVVNDIKQAKNTLKLVEATHTILSQQPLRPFV